MAEKRVEPDPELHEQHAQREAELMARTIREGAGWELVGFDRKDAERVRLELERRTGLVTVTRVTERGQRLEVPRPEPEPMTAVCECEHVQHFDEPHAVHDYGAEVELESITTVRTTHGSFVVCTWCREHHLGPVLDG